MDPKLTEVHWKAHHAAKEVRNNAFRREARPSSSQSFHLEPLRGRAHKNSPQSAHDHCESRLERQSPAVAAGSPDVRSPQIWRPGKIIQHDWTHCAGTLWRRGNKKKGEERERKREEREKKKGRKKIEERERKRGAAFQPTCASNH